MKKKNAIQSYWTPTLCFVAKQRSMAFALLSIVAHVMTSPAHLMQLDARWDHLAQPCRITNLDYLWRSSTGTRTGWTFHVLWCAAFWIEYFKNWEQGWMRVHSWWWLHCDPIQVYNHGLEVSYPPYSNALSSESTFRRECSSRKSWKHVAQATKGDPSWTQVNQFCLASTTSLVDLPCVPVVGDSHRFGLGHLHPFASVLHNKHMNGNNWRFGDGRSFSPTSLNRAAMFLWVAQCCLTYMRDVWCPMQTPDVFLSFCLWSSMLTWRSPMHPKSSVVWNGWLQPVRISEYLGEPVSRIRKFRTDHQNHQTLVYMHIYIYVYIIYNIHIIIHHAGLQGLMDL